MFAWREKQIYILFLLSASIFYARQRALVHSIGEMQEIDFLLTIFLPFCLYTIRPEDLCNPRLGSDI